MTLPENVLSPPLDWFAGMDWMMNVSDLSVTTWNTSEVKGSSVVFAYDMVRML